LLPERRDLVRKVKVGANVPVFVLEFLLGKYCASSDDVAIQMGLQVVNDTLANNYIRPDESSKAQSKVKENGKYSFIDKVKVRLVDSDYWAEAVNFNNKFLHIPNQYVRDYERLLMGGSGLSSTCVSNTTKRRGARTRSGLTN
jgi:ATP-dependent Lon protease